MEETPKQYVGNKEVKSSTVLEKKHRDTIELTEIEYQDGSKQVMPTKMFKASITPASTDDTTLRYARCQPVVKEILEMLLSWGIRIDEVQFVTTILHQSVNNSINTAASKLWQKDSKDIDILDVDKVLVDKVTLADIMEK